MRAPRAQQSPNEESRNPALLASRLHSATMDHGARPPGRIYEPSRMYDAPARFSAHASAFLRGLPPQARWPRCTYCSAAKADTPGCTYCAGAEDGRRPFAARLEAADDCRARRTARTRLREAHGHLQSLDCAGTARPLPAVCLGGGIESRPAAPMRPFEPIVPRRPHPAVCGDRMVQRHGHCGAGRRVARVGHAHLAHQFAAAAGAPHDLRAYHDAASML